MEIIRIHTDKLLDEFTDTEYNLLLDDITEQVKTRLNDGNDRAIVYVEQQAAARVLRAIYACQYDRINEKIYFFHGKGEA